MAESPPLNNLPVPSTRLSGRQREIAEVGQHLCDSRLVTLTGPAGCGKTRLALAVARAVLPEFRHGVWLVELAPLAEAEWLTQTVAGALGVREEPGQSPYAPLRDHLRPRHLLMVLDGVDRLSAQCVWLADPLLADCPHLKILITSRAPLELREAVTWPVPPLSLPGVEPEGSEPLPRSDNAEEGGSGGEATGLTASDAAALFVERATVARPDFAPTPENSAAVAPLCCRLEGNPLAIELAAGWMKWLPPQQVLQELNRHETHLARRREGQPAPKPLDLLLDWSLHHLTEEERRLLRRLAVFEGGCTPTAVRSVCARGGVAEAEATSLLDQLEQRSLVVKRCESGPAGGARYHLPGAVHQHAGELLQRSRELRQLRRLHHEWYLSLTYRDDTTSEGAGLEAWLAQIEADQHNLRAALRWCQEQRDRPALWEYAANLWWFWYSQRHLSEGETRLSRLQWPQRAAATGGDRSAYPREGGWETPGAAAVQTPVPGRWNYLLQLCLETALCALPVIALVAVIGVSMLRARNYGTFAFLVLLVLLASGTLFTSARNHLAVRARAVYAAGVFAEVRGDYSAARQQYQRSLAIDRLLFDRRSAASKRLCLGHLEFRAGDTARAKAWYEASLATARRLRWKEGVSDALAALGKLHHHEEMQPRHDEANALLTDGSGAYLKGDFAAARSLFEASRAAWQDLENLIGVAAAQTGVALIALSNGDYYSARAGLEISLSLAIKQDAESVARTALIGLGSLARSIGQMNLARTRLEQAMTLARRHGDSSSEGIILLNQAEIDLWAGELDAAEARSTRALALGQELNEEPLIAPALASLGRLARRRGHRDEARALYRDSLRRFRALEYQTEIAAVLEELAGVAADDGRPEAAARLWGTAAALRETLGAPLPPVERPDYERDVAAARAALGEPTFTAVWEAGRSEPLAQVVSSALE